MPKLSRRELVAQSEYLISELKRQLLGHQSPVKDHPEFQSLWQAYQQLEAELSRQRAASSEVESAIDELEVAEKQLSDQAKELATQNSSLFKWATQLGQVAFSGRQAGEIADHPRFKTRQTHCETLKSLTDQESSLVAEADAKLSEKAKLSALRLAVVGKIKVEKMKTATLERELGRQIIENNEEDLVRWEGSNDVVDSVKQHREKINNQETLFDKAREKLTEKQAQFAAMTKLDGEMSSKALRQHLSQLSLTAKNLAARQAEIEKAAEKLVMEDSGLSSPEIQPIVNQLVDLQRGLEESKGALAQVLVSGEKNQILIWGLLSAVAVVLLVFATLILFGFLLGDRHAKKSQEKLKAIGIALEIYHNTHKHFPASQSGKQDKNSGHSWRTHILEYLELQNVVEQMDLTANWDEEPNASLGAQSLEPLKPFHCSADEKSLANDTSFVGIVGEQAFFAPRPLKEGLVRTDSVGRKYSDISDDHATTIAVIEAHASGILWAEPKDYTIEEAILRVKEGPEYTNVVMVDGSVRRISRSTSEEQLRAMMTINGGEEITALE